MDTMQKYMRSFTMQFILRTEGISYFVIVPMIIFYVVTCLGLSTDQMMLFVKIAMVVFVISFITTNINNLMVIAPVQRYFRKIMKGETVDNGEYALAKKRFLSLPYLHSFGAFFRWVFGLAAVIIPFTFMADITRTQSFNMWMTVFINAPLGTVLYFLLTELYVQKLLNAGAFSRWASMDFKYRIMMFTRLWVSILVITLVPFLTLLTYFLIFAERARVEESYFYLKLGIIGSFGFICATGVAYALSRSIIDKVRIVLAFLRGVSDGKLYLENSETAVHDEITLINKSVWKTKENLKIVVTELASTSLDLRKSGESLMNSAGILAKMSQDEAAIIEQTSSAYEEMSAAFETNINSTKLQSDEASRISGDISVISDSSLVLSKRIAGLRDKARESVAVADESGTQLNRTVAAINELAGYIQNINEMIEMINDVADQTNLLALNAAIEAARAGEHGKGFAVVADEVNKLADRTTSLANDIKKIISERLVNIGAMTSFLKETEKAFGNIRGGINEMGAAIDDVYSFTEELSEKNAGIRQRVEKLAAISNDIYNSSTEQKSTNEELTKAIYSMSESSQHTSQNADLVHEAAEDINVKSAKLHSLIEQFRLEE